jgi:hypothetical protein
VDRPDIAQYPGLLGAAHDVDQADAVGGADPHEHLPDTGSSGGVDEGVVALGAHRLKHQEGGERVDEQRCSLGGADIVGQFDDGCRVGHPVVSPHRSEIAA